MNEEKSFCRFGGYQVKDAVARAGIKTLSDYANKIHYVMPENFGAVADGVTDNREALQAMFDYAIANNKNVYIPAGVYAFSGQILFPANQAGMIITGAGKYKAVFKALTDDSSFYFTDFHRFEISQLRFIGTGTETAAMIQIAAKGHLSTIRDCVINSNMGLHIKGAAYLAIRDTSFVKISESLCSYLMFVESGEYLYVDNCYFEGLQAATADTGVIINELQFSYFNNCDVCNFSGGIGLEMKSAGGGIHDVAVRNTTFVRDKTAIKIFDDVGITNITLDNLSVFMDGDEECVIYNTRSSGTTGSITNLHGCITMRGTLPQGKDLFYTGIHLMFGNDYLKVFNQTSNAYSYSEVFPIMPIVSYNTTYKTIQGDSNVVEITLLKNSPYRNTNIPKLEWFVKDGAQPVSVEMTNEYMGNMVATVTYADTVTNPWTQLFIMLKPGV